MIIDSKFSYNEHIVCTTQQWESSSIKYKIIPTGCLCVELTNDGKTRVKIGEGNKYYEQLPYVDADIDMEQIVEIIKEYMDNYATKEYVDYEIQIVDNTVHDLDEQVTVLKETVDGFDERITDVETDVSGMDTKVDTLDHTVSTYNNRINSLELKAHTHNNKSTLDAITAPYTTQEKNKLAGIADHANNYSLPPATNSTLGGIIVGNNLQITTEGVLSATGGGSYVLPVANDKTLGGVKINGNNLSIDSDGLLHATDTNTEYDAGTGVRIDTPVSGNDQIVNTGVLDVTKNSSGNLVVSKESGNTIITLPSEYTLPIATTSTLGGIIAGNNLTINTTTGVLDAISITDIGASDILSMWNNT